MGAGNRSAIGTLVERRTRYLILIHVPTGRATTEARRGRIIAAMGQLPAQLRPTLTWDPGKELAMQRQISDQIGTQASFCDALAVAVRLEREHARAAARQLPQGHRPAAE